MSGIVRAGEGRDLTPGERRALSTGLGEALQAAGARPKVLSRAHPAALFARLWRGRTPIVARPGRIFWPDAPADASARPMHMAILQHELQHVLEYAVGELSALRYLANPRNWTYDYRLNSRSRWRDFGAEQRAQIVEDLWRIEHGLLPGSATPHRRVIPWARRA